jgi:hypothetical protein
MFSLFQILQVFIFNWSICNFNCSSQCEEKWMEALNVILIGKKFIVCLSLQQEVQNYSGFNI